MVETMIVLGLILAWFIYTYNRLIGQIEAVYNNKQQIEIQLDRRYKVFESMIDVVKKTMDYEKTTLKDVVALRNQAVEAQQSGDANTRIKAEEGISKIVSNIKVLFEQYPTLRANENMLQLQEEIVNTENKLSYSKQAYNDSIEQYHATKKSLLQSFVVNLMSNQLNKTFEYWGIAEERVQSLEDYKVKLD